jgi:hypothetical protein
MTTRARRLQPARASRTRRSPIDNEAATNPHLKEDAQKAGSGYGLLEWPTLLRSLDRQDRSYQD